MKLKNLILRSAGFFLLFVSSSMGQTWTLPKQGTVKENGPRTYRFTVDYSNADVYGKILQVQRVTGEYTRGLPDDMAVWNNVSIAQTTQPGGPLGPARTREFMNGFRYNPKTSNSMAPDFFKGFPDGSVLERNLVWDTGMFEFFGQQQFEHLKLNQPYHLLTNQDVKMPGVGTFHNRDIELVWIGKSQRNGQECALIEYRAFLNPLEVKAENMEFKGRSHYWGLIWVSLKTRQIEYGTLYEDVLLEMNQPDGKLERLVSVMRNGVFEPVTIK